MRMGESELTRRIYMSTTYDGNVRGHPPVERKDRMLEYVRERMQEREGWKM